MRRRDVIKAIAGSATAWPLAARAQQDQRVRRIGVLLGDFPENAPEARAVVAAFREELQKLGWAEGRNIRILLLEDIRELGSNSIDVDELFRRATKEAVADVKKAEEDSKIDSGWLDSTGWHWFGGLLSFLGQTLGYLLYYGSAFLIFSNARSF
jgi:hypothetical protein